MISIVIPAFEQYGHGEKTLTALLESIEKQKGASFQVVVSDNSDHNFHGIAKVCIKFREKFPLYYTHSSTKGISHNTNNAIKYASYSMIKPMFQDDLFLEPDALVKIIGALQLAPWVACSGHAIDARGVKGARRTPTYSDSIIKGRNTIGMPSVVAYRKNGITFDPHLKTMLDCAFYYEMFQKYGPPAILTAPLIGSRYWPGSTSRKQGSFVTAELPYLKLKYNL